MSHIALDFGEFIVHSNLRGLHLTWAKTFRKHTQVVFELERVRCEQTLLDMERLDALLEKHEFSLYDFGALLFLGISFAASKYLKLPLPKRNLWQSSGLYMCTEWGTDMAVGKADSIVTPYKLYLNLKSTGEWRDSCGGESQKVEAGRESDL